MGAGYPNRRLAFSRMVREDSDFARRFALWGTEWDGEEPLRPLLRREGARVSPEDCVRIFNAVGINLNLHSSVHTDRLVSGGDFVNPRTFEVAACGAFQLVDERGLLPELFAPDEMATFRDLDGLREGIRHFLTHPEERRAYAEKARQRVLREHTYAHRMQRLLDFARERLPGFGARKGVAWPEDMPEDMRQSAETLMRELQLPSSAGFDDVVTAVRGKNERLSDAEAALLFLDEWRKLYS
jgi:spore maturation protein CgeB